MTRICGGMGKQKIDSGIGTITAGRSAFTSVGVIALRENSTHLR
jgi:hypothetical protein